MLQKKITTGKQSNENIIQKLMDSARTITAYANDVKKSAETIITLSHTQGTKEDSHKTVLLRMVDVMKRLVALYKLESKWYQSAAVKLVDGAPDDKVLSALLAYNVFINDQIKSELDSFMSKFTV